MASLPLPLRGTHVTDKRTSPGFSVWVRVSMLSALPLIRQRLLYSKVMPLVSAV
ncbi:MAG: hypothetical protein KAU03_00475 [Candidatus Altiarchaeales archaeon]|nr:hypothetical protein [Candidatus Altiarchaeales archaeon]